MTDLNTPYVNENMIWWVTFEPVAFIALEEGVWFATLDFRFAGQEFAPQVKQFIYDLDRLIATSALR